jgi:hypothetical protein
MYNVLKIYLNHRKSTVRAKCCFTPLTLTYDSLHSNSLKHIAIEGNRNGKGNGLSGKLLKKKEGGRVAYLWKVLE